MRSKFRSEPMCLRELLSGKQVLKTPAFQRRYAWTPKEAGQLIVDLLHDFVSEPEPASPAEVFLGTILLLSEVGAPAQLPGGADPASQSEHEIIDGLQRLVTLSVLVAVLRDAIEDADVVDELERCLFVHSDVAPAPPRLGLPDPEGGYLREAVFRRPGEREAGDDGVDTDGEERFAAVLDLFRQEIGDLAPDQRIAFARYLLEACTFIIVVTADIDRALQMFTVLNDRGKPLASKDVIKAFLLGDLPVSERSQALQQWHSLEHALGQEFEPLFSHIRAIEGGGREKIVTEIKAAAMAAGGGRLFLEETMLPLGEARRWLLRTNHMGFAEAGEVNRHLSYLGWLGASDWCPPSMLFHKLHAEDPVRLLAFLRGMERLAFAMLILGLGGPRRLQRYRAVIADIKDGDAWSTPESALALTRDEQKNVLFNISHDLHGRSPQACKLLLMRLNDELAGGSERLVPTGLTVEHVLPMRPSRTSLWRQWYPRADMRDYCTGCLGNLTLIAKRDNDKARNLEFEKKREVYLGAASINALTSTVIEESTWQSEQVLRRDERLLAAVRAMWSIEGTAGWRG
ncbi:MAG: DUF262 domain-containing protein [Hyphomicrobiaceae bacterium]|nr:DUF262 domain-containing protein [Hyphomicrobiaceae bacterium]